MRTVNSLETVHPHYRLWNSSEIGSAAVSIMSEIETKLGTSVGYPRSVRAHLKRNDAGYTLLELLVVMGILAILTAFATPQLMGYFGKAKTQSVQLQIENINTALELYYMENGAYPSASAGLKALVETTSEAPRWNGPYLKKAKNLLDPWGRPYQYTVSNGEYDVYSLGPNGKDSSKMREGTAQHRGS
jgi:general secretion pathway protein G